MVTTEFAEAVDSQSRSLGFEPGIVWVPHPIQNRTTAELEQLANNAIDAILEMITDSADRPRIPGSTRGTLPLT